MEEPTDQLTEKGRPDLKESRAILYVHGNSDMVGGIETFLYDSFFHHRNFTPHALFINDGVLPKRIKDRGIENVAILNGGRLRRPLKTFRAIRKISRYIQQNNVDVVLAHGHHAWIYAGLAAKLAGIKSIFFAHQIMDPADMTLRHPIEWLGSHMTPSLILANSVATKKSVETIWGKSCLKPRYGIDLERFLSVENDNGSLRSTMGISKESHLVTAIGRIQEWKGQEHLLKAAPAILKAVPDTYFMIVGSLTFEKDFPYLDRLKTIARDSRIEDHVRFTGFREDIPEVLAASDIVVHTSIRPEPFGLVVLEAMAAGKAVIATNAGGPTEIVHHEQDGFLIPLGDENAISSIVIRLLNDTTLRTTIGKNARARATEFSIDRCMQDIETILEDLVCSK